MRAQQGDVDVAEFARVVMMVRVSDPPDDPPVPIYLQHGCAIPKISRTWSGPCDTCVSASGRAAASTTSPMHGVKRRRGTWRSAGRRVHGSTGHVPLVVFDERERAHLLPIGDEPHDVPVWRAVTVHPDHHVSFKNGLYSAPSS